LALLYTLQWTNRRPKYDLDRITLQHMPGSEAKLAVLAVTLMTP